MIFFRKPIQKIQNDINSNYVPQTLVKISDTQLEVFSLIGNKAKFWNVAKTMTFGVEIPQLGYK
jgi:hypothetical protein